MNCLKFSFNTLMLVLGYLAFPCLAMEFPEKYPELIMHGESYPNTCEPARQEALRNMLFANNVKAPEQAWRVVTAILCSPNDTKNRDYLKQAVQEKVRMSLESTGETPDVQTVARSNELVNDLIAAGHAWKASIQVEAGKVILQYFANETCVKGVTLSFERGKWSVHEFGVACD